MRIFKSAFTLAEVMIAMGIIGIVAAVTIPQVVTSTLKNEAGAILGRTVEQIETGCQNIIQKANDNITVYDGGFYEGLSGLTTKEVFGIGSASFDSTGLFDNGKAFFGITEIENPDTYLATITDIKGNASYQYLKGNTKVYLVDKQKSLVYLDHGNKGGTEIDSINNAVFIDTNGTAKPNQGGKDIFIFGITNQGKLIPRGTKKYQEYYSTAPLYTADCEKDAIVTGWSCAAKVVKDGYRITYY